MILKSEIIQNKNGAYHNQITWSKNSDGTLEQLWEITDKNNIVIKEVFRGLYKKSSK